MILVHADPLRNKYALVPSILFRAQRPRDNLFGVFFFVTRTGKMAKVYASSKLRLQRLVGDFRVSFTSIFSTTIFREKK